MTSTLTSGPEQQHLEGHTVRDIVEHDPAQVNEVWCRKIFRQLLQSLELQYAMRMPHRAITPDTVVFHDNGEPLLLPSAVDDAEPDEAADLTALARVVHFAITRELVPTGPLRGRVLEGYSESLITAVDRCMSADPAARPRTVDELRHILGIVSLGPAAPAFEPAAPAMTPASTPLEAGTLPSFMDAPAASRLGKGLSRWQRWAIAAGGAAVLIAIALAVFAELRDSGSYDHIVLTLPQSGEPAQDRPRAAAPLPPPPPQVAEQPALPARPDAQAVQADANGAPAALPQHAAPAVAAPAAAPGSATYRLKIQPWGIVYVDGVDRGASPPVKRLTLAPGRHTIRIANPNFHDRVLEVDTSGGGGQIAVDFSDEPR
ncbi:hypothetical protein ACI48D_22775 [Massilia sp. LXY-6]|uniref:hypothetical protein n=1 Tax=Massilia sp. LXY-6 TaxID=3379823 RepID=UPI003EE0F21C